eukprot:TRINITY_DN0_c1512_g1_i3.p1 TRINITY_DN0_c1512_g1~~TRINITY_DN0_c1512_g1_i3.p1  ORF type:complete len:137 (+),score=36.82 TRINITY_DN0_c1512_g1_i3:1-411(+)
MPRRGGGGFGGGRTSSPPRSSTISTPPPRMAPPTTAPQRGGFFRDMAGTMATGMAFGAGSEVAHQAVRGIMGGGSHSQPQTVYVQQPDAGQAQQQQQAFCDSENKFFIECLKKNSDSISTCQPYLDVLKECEKRLK